MENSNLHGFELHRPSSKGTQRFIRVDLNPSKTKSMRSLFETWGPISHPFFWIGTENMSGSFFVPALAQWLCKGPRTLRKFPQKCQKIAGCEECAVYGIASKPGSSPPERPGPDNITSHPWSRSLAPVPLLLVLCLVFKQKGRDKAEVSTWRGGTGASCFRPLLTRDLCLDWVVSEGTSQVSRRSEVGNHKQRTLDTQLSSGTFLLLALLRKFVPGLEEINDPKWTGILYQI